MKCKFKCKFCWLTHNAHTKTTVIWNSMCKIYIHSRLSFLYLQHMSLGKITSRQRWVWRLHVEQSPKPLAILTFNQDDVRSVSLTVSRTTQPKQSQTLQLKLIKETWWPVRPRGVCVWLRSSSANQLTFNARRSRPASASTHLRNRTLTPANKPLCQSLQPSLYFWFSMSVSVHSLW